jgi:hypothetical protein
VINQWTTLPVPHNEKWQAATAQDNNLNKAALTKRPLEDMTYYKEWLKGKL